MESLNVHPQDTLNSPILSAADSASVSTNRDLSLSQDCWPRESRGSSRRPYGSSVLGSILSLVQYPSHARNKQWERWGKGRDWLYRSIIEQEALDQQPINYLEFGVYRGDSLRLWLAGISHPDSRFVGFDTFTGLPERWRPTEPAGHFNANGAIPDIKDPRCSFEVGLFQDTLPAVVSRTNLTGRLVVNMDADMFTSTLFVLTTLAPYMKSGDIIFFDEFSCPLDEFRAFEEFVRSFRVKYEVVAAVYGYTRVCIKIQ